MHSLRPSWKFVRQSPLVSGIAPSSVGVVLNYGGREARLSISLGRPISATESEDELIMAELKQLQNALAVIVA